MILDNAQSHLYIQLSELFRQRIHKGFWKKGDRLPSLEALSDEFRVARVTVRQAVDRLTTEGLLKPQRGKGTFVTGMPLDERWLHVETTLDKLSAVYRDTDPTILNTDESSRLPQLTADDGLAAPSYVYMRRVHSRKGTPYCVIDIYLDAEIFFKKPDAFRRQTVIPLLMDLPDIEIVSARQVLTISSADVEVAHHLGIKVNSPVAEVRRILVGSERRVIYLGEVTYRGDFVRMEFDLKA